MFTFFVKITLFAVSNKGDFSARTSTFLCKTTLRQNCYRYSEESVEFGIKSRVLRCFDTVFLGPYLTF